MMPGYIVSSLVAFIKPGYIVSFSSDIILCANFSGIREKLTFLCKSFRIKNIWQSTLLSSIVSILGTFLKCQVFNFIEIARLQKVSPEYNGKFIRIFYNDVSNKNMMSVCIHMP
jgi:hypothetical protein